MIKFVVLLMLIACVARGDDEKWNQFKSKHGKEYHNETHEAQHKANFVQNAKEVDEHNAQHDEGKVGFRKALYEFDDKTKVEARAKKTCLKSCGKKTSRALPQSYPTPKDFPKTTEATIDYTDKLQPVVDQGSAECASCWAFAAIARLEFLSKEKNPNFNTPLSQQFLVDCDTTNGGCDGGCVAPALTFLKAKGAVLASDYPYTASQGKCQSKTMLPNVITSVADFETEDGLTEDNMKNILAKDGPFTIFVHTSAAFINYKSGILDDASASNCDGTDHIVLLVGYGTDLTDKAKPKPFWKIRNSWGPKWGEAGYIRILRGSNIVGMACAANYAT